MRLAIPKLVLWKVCVRVDRDRVVAHGGLQVLSVGIREKHFGFLQRHVAVDAIAGNLISELGMFAALRGLVTSQAARRK